MNKKLRSFSLVLIMIIAVGFVTPLNISAQETTLEITSKTIEYLGDGIICETIIEEIPMDNSAMASRSSSIKTRSGSKTATYKNASSGATLWSVRVTGNFRYNGTTSSATSSSVTATSLHNLWKIPSRSSSYSGNTARATATGQQYSGNSIIFTATRTVSLSCSRTGVLN